MAEYDVDVLENIEANVDLLEYVSQQIDMVQKGAEYFGSCPLHIDKTPSFSITPEKNKYYCFSCGRGGGIISYLRHYEHLCMDDAVNKAANLGNVDLSQMCQSQTVSFIKRLQKLKHKEEKFEHPILDYKEYEKYDKETIEEWLNEGIRQEEIDLFDIRVDKRTNRIVYPVHDIDGNFINIKGRTRFANFKLLDIAKYMNYYKVGSLDYFQGYIQTKEFIEEKKEIIIFESIKSVMKCYGWGYKNCVSAESHSLSDWQIKHLIRMRVDVVFAYDKDVNYYSHDVQKQLNKLKRFTNVFVIDDREGLLGDLEEKNSPADLGKDTWELLYEKKKRIL